MLRGTLSHGLLAIALILLPACTASADPDSDLANAIRAGNAPAVAAAIAHRADPWIKAGAFDSAPALALAIGDEPVLRALTDARIDWRRVGDHEWNALHIVLHRTDRAVGAGFVESLLASGLRVSSTKTRPVLGFPAAARDPAILAALLAAGYDPNQRALETSASPISIAASEGSAACIRALLNAKASPSATAGRGRTPLHAAAARTDSDAPAIIADLVRAGANVDARDDDGWTPLLSAIWTGSPSTIRALLDAGADPRGGNGGHSRPLILAARLGLSQIVQMLIQRGALPNQADSRGATPLWWAIFSADPRLRSTWRYTAPPPTTSTGAADGAEPAGREPFSISFHPDADYEGAVRTLVESGADPRTTPPGAEPPLTMVAHMWILEDSRESGAGPVDSKTVSWSQWLTDQRFRREFAAAHHPATIAEILIRAGAARIVSDAPRRLPDPLDLAAARPDSRGRDLVRALAKAPVTHP